MQLWFFRLTEPDPQASSSTFGSDPTDYASYDQSLQQEDDGKLPNSLSYITYLSGDESDESA